MINIKIGVKISGSVAGLVNNLIAWWRGSISGNQLVDFVNIGDARAVEQGEAFYGTSTSSATNSSSLVDDLIDDSINVYASVFIPTFVAAKSLFEVRKVNAEWYRMRQTASNVIEFLSSGFVFRHLNYEADSHYEYIFNGTAGYYRKIEGFYNPNPSTIDVFDGTWTALTTAGSSGTSSVTRIMLYPSSDSLAKIGTMAVLDASMNLKAMWSASCIIGSSIKDLVGDIDLAISGDVGLFVVNDNHFHNYNNENGYTDDPSYAPAKISALGKPTGLDTEGNALTYVGNVPLPMEVTGTITDGYLNPTNTITPPICPKLFLADLPVKYLYTDEIPNELGFDDAEEAVGEVIEANVTATRWSNIKVNK